MIRFSTFFAILFFGVAHCVAQPAQTCRVHINHFYKCPPYSSAACAGSLCVAGDRCSSGTKLFKIMGDDYGTEYQAYTLSGDSCDGQYPSLNPTEINCTVSGSCYCRPGNDFRLRCYMDLVNPTRDSFFYYPLVDPTCAQMINEAWALFFPTQPPPCP